MYRKSKILYNKAMIKSISGKKAVVFGGSGGIGAAVSRKLASEGVNLLIHGGHDEEKLFRIKEDIQRTYPDITVDTLLMPVEKLLPFESGAAEDAVKNADIICFCCGPFLQKPVHETSLSEIEAVINSNFVFPASVIAFALPFFAARKYGRFIVFGGTDTASFRGFRTNAMYAAAKTALCSLVKSVAIEYSASGITCNAILPGFVETEYLSPELKKSLEKKIPGGKLIPPEDIAEAVSFLLKTDSVNGTFLNIDCGWAP